MNPWALQKNRRHCLSKNGEKMKKLISTFILLLLVSVPAAAYDKNIDIYDCTNDYQDYIEAVASANKEEAVSTADVQEGEGLEWVSSRPPSFAVLVRTNGIEPVLIEEGLTYVIRGPEFRYILYYSSQKAAFAAVRELSRTQGVLYAECDSEVSAAESGTMFHSWGAGRLKFDEYLPYSTEWGSGTSAVVAVIDSGVYRHSLIDPKMPESGYDYVDADSDSTNDLNGHGTHVGGIIADCTRSAPVYIYPIRVLKADGKGKMSNIVTAIAEARQKGVEVINLSVESTTVSEALDYEIGEAVRAGCTVVVAAGNSNADTSGIWPAHLDSAGVIVVGSVEDKNGDIVRAGYSNYGNSVDVYTFGSDISSCSVSNGYVTRSGTSMAAPHISGLCSLLHLLHPDAAPEEIEDRIRLGTRAYNDMLVPDLSLMIPEEEGFSLHHFSLETGEKFYLPAMSRPFTAKERILYTSSDPAVAAWENDCLVARTEGCTTITARSLGFPEVSFLVEVQEPDGGICNLPSSLKVIETEAFSGVHKPHTIIIPEGTECIEDRAFLDLDRSCLVFVPQTVEEIGQDSFADAVVICPEGSFAAEYAAEQELQYVLQ